MKMYFSSIHSTSKSHVNIPFHTLIKNMPNFYIKLTFELSQFFDDSNNVYI